MVHLFLWKRHVDTWGILLQMIWMTMKIYVANWDVFMEGLTCYVPSELVHTQWNCFCLCPTVEVCTPPAFGVNTPKKQYYQMEVAYNNVFRRFFGYDRFSSASQMFVENRVENFETRTRRLIYGLRERLNASRNSLVICSINSVAWSSSELRQKWGKYLYMQSWINT